MNSNYSRIIIIFSTTLAILSVVISVETDKSKLTFTVDILNEMKLKKPQFFDDDATDAFIGEVQIDKLDTYLDSVKTQLSTRINYFDEKNKISDVNEDLGSNILQTWK